MNNPLTSKYFRYGLLLIGGLFLGWLFFHSPSKTGHAHDQEAPAAQKTIWTCSMHPQIRRDAPGQCPLCGMDLIPLNPEAASGDTNALHLTREAAELANVQTTVVSRQKPVKEVRLYGKVQADERLLQSQVAHFPGRIEKLSVNFTGEPVRRGQVLALIYSPEVMTAQQELLEASRMKSPQPEIYEAAKEKLLQWKLTDQQIAEIEKSGAVKRELEVVSGASGVVTMRRVNNGDHVEPGTVLFEVADLSRVWVMFDAYESDLPYVRTGDPLTFMVQALPGVSFSGTIAFIDPVINPVTRVAKARVEIANSEGRLKPEMSATGLVNARLDAYRNNLVIPRTAVLWTGKRSIVYVKQEGSEEPVFKLREIELGPALGNSYVVVSGLSEGEAIVTQGAFNVDAASQLEGKPSMMTPKPGDDDPAKSGETAGTQAPAEHAQFRVEGKCGMCKDRIEKAALSVHGVKSASWDQETQQIHLQFEGGEAVLRAVHKAIAAAGHDTEKMKAPDEAYKKLPECCLYR